MVRACCVSTCRSGKNVPSHLFPKNIERRKLWLERLRINPESEVEKLRVCYKHFHDSDYSCSPTRRILKNIAIPSIHISSIGKNITTASTSTAIPNLSQHIFENNEKIQNICCKKQHKQLESQLQDQRQLILQVEKDYNIFIKQQQQNKQQQELREQQQEIREQQQELREQRQEIREQQQELILEKHGELQQQILQCQEQQAKEIQQLKDTIIMHLQQSPKLCARHFKYTSRKNLLTPRSRKVYEKTVQLKEEKRYLKRCRSNKLNNQIKQQSASKITKHRTNKKGRIDKTAPIRQQIVRMILRNDNVAPQV